MRTFGTLAVSKRDGEDIFLARDVEPHVAIRMKQLFPFIPKWTASSEGYKLPLTPAIARDLAWFMSRYPLEMSAATKQKVNNLAGEFDQAQLELERILTEAYVPRPVAMKGELRHYQAQAVDLLLKTKRLLVADQVGMGKTLVGIGLAVTPGTLPMLVVVPAHLTLQWQEQLAQFTDLQVHIIKKGIQYQLPKADVYVTTYSKLAGWTELFSSGFFKSAVWDECQDLRHDNTEKYKAANILQENAEYVLGLSGTPVYNYGNEIFNILNLIKPGCLGEWSDFSREWLAWEKKVKNPEALGSYLREQHLMLRRTRNRAAPNRIVHRVPHDQKVLEDVDGVARQLATTVMSGSFVERGQAARELDVMLRQATGQAKAKYVAEYVKVLLESGEKVLLAGWHRSVYETWLEELKDFSPVMYTGSESPAQKKKSKEDFVSGKSQLMIISLRSGVGLDGLQKAASLVVVGELDWSPAVHDQILGRLDRDGQKDEVTGIFLVADTGTDPLMVEVNGLKSAQSRGILDPGKPVDHTAPDESRIRMLAEVVLKRRGVLTHLVEAGTIPSRRNQ